MSTYKSIFPLNNTIQEYDWGTKGAFTQLFGWPNPEQKPKAELWMGTHPKGPSLIKGSNQSLQQLISTLPAKKLGNALNEMGELRFLFKVLSAAQALSIQVHPSLEQAKEGFKHEEINGPNRSAPHRNYRDSNHKPELICALTPFVAMCGFRCIEQIKSLLDELRCEWLGEWANKMFSKAEHNHGTLKQAYLELLHFDKETQARYANKLKESIQALIGKRVDKADLQAYAAQSRLSPYLECLLLSEYYPSDIAIISPLIMQLEYLEPGEALFLSAGIPHAYLRGTGLEIMAASDNVLRGGLTSKHIDLNELQKIMSAQPMEAARIIPTKIDEQHLTYKVPVDDFELQVLQVEHTQTSQIHFENAAIVFCINQAVKLNRREEVIELKAGESAFVTADPEELVLQGQAKVAIAQAG